MIFPNMEWKFKKFSPLLPIFSFQSSIELTKGQRLEKIHDLSNLSEPLRIIEE